MDIKKELQRICENYGSYTDLERAVAHRIIDQVEDNASFKCFMSDLMQHGCISGMVTSLIYYKDTHDFYDSMYDDIETLRYDYEQETGCKIELPADQDLKNWFAWFAFEHTAQTLASKLGVEI